MLRVRAREDWPKQSLIVYVFHVDEEDKPTHCLHFDQGLAKWDPYVVGAEMPATYSLSMEVVEQLYPELEKLYGSPESGMQKLYRRADQLMATLIEQAQSHELDYEEMREGIAPPWRP